MRVHELAKEIGRSSKDLIQDLKDLGVDVKNHMSALDPSAVDSIRKKIGITPAAPYSGSVPIEHSPAVGKSETGEEALKSPSPVDEKILAPEEAQEVQEAGTVPVLDVTLPISIREFSDLLKTPVNKLMAKLMDLGEILSINASLSDEDMISLIAAEFHLKVNFKRKEAEALPSPENIALSVPVEEVINAANLRPRPPVVTIMGHVDHGKTTLLDYIRKSKVVDAESGGITQHIGAYQVRIKDSLITFLDTPGHEAFTLMRARGAKITDIVILVVAADDGIMPQTLEAIHHCQAAGVPMIVVINKIDKANASLDMVKRQLSEKGLTSEDWGGQTIVCELSAKTGAGVDHLLEMILLQAEVMELKADPIARGRGVIIESELTPGRGPTATILVKQGTFHVGDCVICGTAFGKIKALIDDLGRQSKEAAPSAAVELLGLSDVPEIGIEIRAVKNEKIARELSELKFDEGRKNQGAQLKKVTLEDIFQKITDAQMKELKVILKVDVKGSLEALEACLAGVKSEKIELRIIHKAVGDISENDVMLASASGAVIIGFHTKASVSVKDLAKKEGVEIRLYSIIYEIVHDIKQSLEGMLDPVLDSFVIGHARVDKIFDISKHGRVAGCRVIDGKVLRSSKVRVLRAGDQIFEGVLQSLKRFKDEVKEVKDGFECGIKVSDFDGIEEGDTLEFFEIRKSAQKL